MLDKLTDLALEISDGVQGAAANRLATDQGGPTLDLIEAGAMGRGEVQVKARPTRQPGAHLGVLVRAVVVADQMHIEMFRDVGLDVTQEGAQLWSWRALAP